MNRRLMMQQAKGFELVYDAASGALPTTQGWTFRYLMYGNSIGGTQSMSANLLNVEVKHVYEVCSYHIKDKPTAKNCELSLTVENLLEAANTNNGIMGILLTNGEKAIQLVLKLTGELRLTNNANSQSNSIFVKWVSANTPFKLKMRLENGIVSVWFNDNLTTQTNKLYDVSEIYTIENAMADGTPVYYSFPYLFRDVRNSISFANGNIYQISNMTYKEW